MARTPRQFWQSSRQYQLSTLEAAKDAARDPNHRKVVDRVRAAVARAREMLEQSSTKSEA
jgi:hypothetical protein